MAEEWIGDVRFPPDKETKLRDRGLTPDQVRSAIAWGNHDEARWDDDSEHGRRLMVMGSDDESRILVFLIPLDRTDGLWECRTAWRV